MQRKNSILKQKNHSYRSGMAMIMAIAVVVILSTIMALSLSLTTQTSKKTTDLYLYEQSILLSQSAAEYAMLRISLVSPCSLDNINFQYNNTFNIDVSMRYLTLAATGTCFNNANADGTNYAVTTNPDSDGSVIMDITVSTLPNIGTEPITYFRRSIQKL